MASAEQVRAHYDVSAELFALFLDRDYRAYSAGNWQRARDLEQAQRDNLKAIVDAVGITTESSVLDVGCGWGAFAQMCLRDLGVRSYVGLTPSRAQIASITSRIEAHEHFHACTWQDFTARQGQFDAVVALESMEHFATRDMRRSGGAPGEYRRFFEFCAASSRARSGLYLQTSLTRRRPRTRAEIADFRFILEEVFNGSALATLDALIEASGEAYELRKMSWGGQDYIRTLEAWRARLHGARDVFTRRFGEERYEFFERYLVSCIRVFEAGAVDLLRAQFVRKG